LPRARAAAWQPLGATTEEEVVFLSPLEFVSARGPRKRKSSVSLHLGDLQTGHTRKYGPYTMPVLYGDQLCAPNESGSSSRCVAYQRTMAGGGIYANERILDGFQSEDYLVSYIY
jgi:hypothetical protein